VPVEAADNDLVRLWSSIAGAFEAAGREALERLSGPGAVARDGIDALAAALEAGGRPAILALDDLQLLDDARCLRSIDYAIDTLPPNVRLVAISRTVPRLRIARLRAQGQLAELGAAELAFTAAEARRLFDAVEGLRLDDDAVAELTARTEGWPAALYLAALALRGRTALGAFRASAGPMGEYLAAEVLGELDARTRRFLHRTSVLTTLSGDLCDAVTGESGGEARLRELERSNLLVVLERPGRYRYHDLLREYLLANLDPAEAEAARRAAIAWSQERGLPEDAAEYARAASDWETLARLVEDHLLTLLRTGRSGTLARWTASLPRATLLEHPTALVGGMVAAHAIARPAAEIRRLLALALAVSERDPRRWTTYDRAILELVRAQYGDDDVGGAVAAGEAAVECAREHDELLVAALASRALTALLAGDEAGAAGAARAALAHPGAAARPIAYSAASAALAIVHARAGRRNLAREAADSALAAARRADVASSPPGAYALLADALAAVLESRIAHAQVAAARAARATIAGGVWQAWALLELAGIELMRGRVNAAQAALSHAEELIATARDAGALPARVAEVRAALEDAPSRKAPVEAPSAAELAVLRLLPHRTVREIAETLYLSVNTIRSHIRSLYRKLGVNSRADAVSRATALGFIDESEL
jgi:LuxR family maltose regulon positive regulatory protein